MTPSLKKFIACGAKCPSDSAAISLPCSTMHDADKKPRGDRYGNRNTTNQAMNESGG